MEYGGYEIKYKWLDGPKARLTLMEIDDFFKSFGIPMWLEYGTLLGAIREKRFIVYDFDIDIGIYARDAIKIVNNYKDFQKKFMDIQGHTSHWVIGPDNILSKIVLAKRNIKIDVDIWWPKKKTRFRFIHWNQEKGTYQITEIDRKFHDTFETAMLCDREYRVPAFTEEYLEVMYGKDWRQPVVGKSGDWYTRKNLTLKELEHGRCKMSDM